ncbi:MAG: lipocalin-like domain-containing protein [Acidiferrobacterales bacterium]
MSMRRCDIGPITVLLFLACSGAVATTQSTLRPPAPPTEDLAALLGPASATGYARADRPRTFRFPRDFGPHPGFRTEWWYFTGNLGSTDGRRFGYELTLFRYALSPASPMRRSHWATNEVYMAHFAITDTNAKRFRYFQQIARAAVGLAGSQARPFRVWVDNWGVQAIAGSRSRWRLHAAADRVSLNLDLRALMPPVLQGDHGLSRKSVESGNASYYYSIPRFATRGTLSIKGRTISVSGLSWMDREWSTSVLAPNQAGWDWFGLQLSDGSSLMFYHLRRKDGSFDPYSHGSLIDPGGQVTQLGAGDVRLQVLSRWQSPRGGIYPERWRLLIRKPALTLDVTPILADQELDVAVRYWEGAVSVRGRRGNVSLTGRGYVELTGYARVAASRQLHN